MEAQDVDSSVTATLTCLMTNISDTFDVTWFSENGIIKSESGGYLAKQGSSKFEYYRFVRKFSLEFSAILYLVTHG